MAAGRGGPRPPTAIDADREMRKVGTTGGADIEGVRGVTRRFELPGSPPMWWEIELAGRRLTTTTGIVGAPGSPVSRDFPSEADAHLAAESLVAERTSRGYVEVLSGSAQAVEGARGGDSSDAECAACGRAFGADDERFCAGCGTPRASTAAASTVSRAEALPIQGSKSVDPSVVHCAVRLESRDRFAPERRDRTWYVHRLRVDHVRHPRMPWHTSRDLRWCDSAGRIFVSSVWYRPAASVTLLAWTSRGKSELRIHAEFGSNVPVDVEEAFGYWIEFTTSVTFKDGSAAAAALERLQDNPESIVQLLRQCNPPGKIVDALDGPVQPAFRGLRPVRNFEARPSGPDGATSASDLGLLQIAVSEQSDANVKITPKSRSARVDLLRRLPLRPGYAAGIKALIKSAQDPRLFGVAAGRIASGSPNFPTQSDATAGPVPAWVLSMIPEWIQWRRMTKWGLTQDSIDYLNRLVRRRLKVVARTDPKAYVDAALALLGQLDVEGGAPEDRRRAFAANYVIYGSVTRDVGHGRFEELPSRDVRQAQRFDPHPDIWNGAGDQVARAWKLLRHDVDTFTWMTLVLGPERVAELEWNRNHVDLALRSSNAMCVELGRLQLSTRGLEHFRPTGSDPEQWRVFLRLLEVERSFAVRRDCINAGLEALRPAPGSPWDAWFRYFSMMSPLLVGPALHRLVGVVLSNMPAKSPFARRAFCARLIRSGDPTRSALGWLALSHPKVIRADPNDFIAGMPSGGNYSWNAFAPLSDDIVSTATFALSSGLPVDSLWRHVARACSQESAKQIMSASVPNQPDMARLLWRRLDDELMTSTWIQIDQELREDSAPRRAPSGLRDARLHRQATRSQSSVELSGFLRAAVREWGPQAVKDPGPRQRIFLEAWMRDAPGEWIESPLMLEAACRSGDPTLVQAALDLVRREGAMERVWLGLAESRAPLANAAVAGFIEGQLPDRRRDSVLALLDSSVASARDVGWQMYMALPDTDQSAVTEGLLEHRDPLVVERVAKILQGSNRPNLEALRAFDRSLLLSRRSLRAAKGAVQDRWDMSEPSTLDRDVLVELALGQSRVDSDWAWRQLARIDQLSETAGPVP